MRLCVKTLLREVMCHNSPKGGYDKNAVYSMNKGIPQDDKIFYYNFSERNLLYLGKLNFPVK